MLFVGTDNFLAWYQLVKCSVINVYLYRIYFRLKL